MNFSFLILYVLLECSEAIAPISSKRRGSIEIFSSRKTFPSLKGSKGSRFALSSAQEKRDRKAFKRLLDEHQRRSS